MDRIRAYRSRDLRYVRRRADAWAVLGGLVVLTVCMFIVRSGEVGSVEEAVFHAINGLPDFLQAPVWLFQLPGILVFPLLVALVALLLRRYRLAAAIALSVPIKLLLERRVVKVLVERQRPGTSVSDAILRDASPTGLSFPSGHAVLAFALAGLLAPYLGRNGKLVVYTLAALNGVARIYLGAHNPLDIMGGAGLGIAIAGALNLVFGVPAQGQEMDQHR
jgi:membrane-associated phospholipid phosphatase